MREREREREKERQRHRQREKQAPCREPDVVLDPGSPGSRPGPKAGSKLLSHPGIPTGKNFCMFPGQSPSPPPVLGLSVLGAGQPFRNPLMTTVGPSYREPRAVSFPPSGSFLCV